MCLLYNGNNRSLLRAVGDSVTPQEGESQTPTDWIGGTYAAAVGPYVGCLRAVGDSVTPQEGESQTPTDWIGGTYAVAVGPYVGCLRAVGDVGPYFLSYYIIYDM